MEVAKMAPVLGSKDSAFASALITLLHQVDSATPTVRFEDNELATIIANTGLAIRRKLEELGLGPAI
jgi:hypothetical protein